MQPADTLPALQERSSARAPNLHLALPTLMPHRADSGSFIGDGRLKWSTMVSYCFSIAN